MKIGVFDSGVGGLSVVNAIKQALPMHEILYREDKKNIPYGTKTPSELEDLVLPILQHMVDDDCQVIVIACNTVTTTIIGSLRKKLTVPIIGMEPMIKPAAAITKSNVVAVCATPTTLASSRYAQLKKEHAHGITVLEPDCSDWAYLIENKQIDQKHIDTLIDEVCARGADVIVLGCTHYHWIEEIIVAAAKNRAVVMQPELPVIKELTRVISQLR